MSHKNEAEKWLGAAVSPETEKAPAGYAAAEMMTARAQVLATLALVDALEAANEQARIANLIALGLVWRDEVPETGEQAIFGPPTQDAVEQITAALGIGGDA